MTKSASEVCRWCCGSGQVQSERNFLLARLRAANDHRWVGTSSNALVAAVIAGKQPTDRPYDGWDLGRCLVTQAVAPPEMAAAMQPIIDRWTRLINEGGSYHSLKAAREMLVEHADAVRTEWL